MRVFLMAKYKFIGQQPSLGYYPGRVYDLVFAPSLLMVKMMRRFKVNLSFFVYRKDWMSLDVVCPYENLEAFDKNWSKI